MSIPFQYSVSNLEKRRAFYSDEIMPAYAVEYILSAHSYAIATPNTNLLFLIPYEVLLLQRTCPATDEFRLE